MSLSKIGQLFPLEQNENSKKDMNDFAFFITSMPYSRSADYYLGCLEGSVFIDLINSETNSISLRRISFDGYGCCNVGDQVTPMNINDSKKFLNMYMNNSLDQTELTKIIKRNIEENKMMLWADALFEYGFI